MTYFSWKAQTFNQIIKTIRKNENNSVLSTRNLHLAPPLKIYRKETTPSTTIKSSRTGITINDFDSPNGTSVVSRKYITQNSSIATLDTKSMDYDNDCINKQNAVCFSPQHNARKRIRTSGIIKNNYSMDTKQYLQRRSLSYDQNQYNFLQSGNTAVKPGSSASLLNIYTAQQSIPSGGCVPKQVVYKPKNSQFAQNGAVSSSSLIARKKYNTITSNAHEYLLPFGAAVANAMSYGISDSIYTYKNRIAFPTKLTAKSNKYTNTMSFCENASIRR